MFNLNLVFTPVRITLVLVLLVTLIGAVPVVSDLLMFEAQLFDQGEKWRALTAWISQLNYKHWLLNQWGVIMMLVLLPPKIKRIEALSFVFVWLSCSIALALSDYPNYVGLSGLLYGWLLIAAYLTPFYSNWIKTVFCAVLSFKVLSENGILPLPDSGWVGDFIGAQVAYQSHLWGLISGYVAIVVLWVLGRFAKH